MSLLKLVSPGDFALVLTIIFSITDAIWSFSGDYMELAEIIGTCNQALSIVAKDHRVKDKIFAKDLIVNRGRIVFNNVNFKYNKSDYLFQNKSIVIEQGEKIGLVGYSGSGKSTFVNLILRLYDVYSGAIIIDNQNIADVTQESLRKNIAFVQQDSLLFHRSLMENIRYGRPNANDEEVIIAAKAAKAHDFIIQTEHGYETLVGEQGVKLSGGQRQRIAIARAILKKAPILILDEATSSLDSVTENIIQNSLSELMQDKTTIVIAHRLSTLLGMDRILVFSNGKIIQDGSHRKLLSEAGLYKILWNTQVDGFIIG
jgi:ATP-binding cassette subfamily B protein